MTVSVMVTGSLFRTPIQKTAKSGKLYTTATLKAAVGGEVEFWTALAFGETEQAALLNLAEGEVKIYKTVFVDALLALKPAPRERKPKPEKLERAPPAADPSLNDDIPF